MKKCIFKDYGYIPKFPKNTFFTVVAYRRRKIFCQPDFRQALRHAIKKVQRDYPFRVRSWVLLPEHMHTIWSLPKNDSNYSLRWQLIKKYVTRSCKKNYHSSSLLTHSRIKHRDSTLWQRRFYEHLIRDENDFENHLNYCHFNPVKHGYVERAADWPYSTFHRYVRVSYYRQDWGIGFKCESGIGGPD